MYNLYDARLGDVGPPVLVVWLHGADMGDLSCWHMYDIRQRLRRPAYFFLPRNPKTSTSGLLFEWTVCYTNAQNKDGLGWIYGQPHAKLLQDLCRQIELLSKELCATSVYAMGFSMGGFGVLQLAAHAPHVFDAVVSAAGYVQGTLARADEGYHAPQPQARQIFDSWCEAHCHRLAKVGVVVFVHAPADTYSPFGDVLAIVARIRDANGRVQLVEVDDAMAESDSNYREVKPRRPTFHRYFHYTFTLESSTTVLYERIEAFLGASILCMRAYVRALDRSGSLHVRVCRVSV